MSLRDPRALRRDQYKDSSNLNARGALHERFSTNSYGWFRWVHDHLRVPEQGRMLELGCGPGTLWVGHRSRVPRSCRIVLSDASAGMVREAAERLGIGSSFQFAVLDAQAISFASDAFDSVVANHMLYHVPDLSKALSEIRRVLRRAGRLYAATNGRSHLMEIADLIEAFDPALLPMWAKDRRAFDVDNGTEHPRAIVRRHPPLPVRRQPRGGRGRAVSGVCVLDAPGGHAARASNGLREISRPASRREWTPAYHKGRRPVRCRTGVGGARSGGGIHPSC